MSLPPLAIIRRCRRDCNTEKPKQKAAGMAFLTMVTMVAWVLPVAALVFRNRGRTLPKLLIRPRVVRQRIAMEKRGGKLPRVRDPLLG